MSLGAQTKKPGSRRAFFSNAAGQITGVTAKNSASEAPVALVTSVGYQPFGPLGSLTFGNGRVLNKNYDLDYGIASVADSAANGLAIGYTLDDVGNVVGLAERQTGGATAARTVGYDGLDRLTSLKNGTATVQGFTYDATGNRTTRVSGTSATYLYGATSHRLTKVGTVNRSYDAAGNSTAIGTKTYQYDDRGRMASVRTGTTLTQSFRHNALGQRVAKVHPTTATSTVYFVYDEAGKLMGEYKPDGTMIREYLWLDDTLVAMRAGYATHKFQYVLTDHLNTPRAVVLPSTNAIIWRWDLTGSAFGDHAAQNNPDGDATNYMFNLRYPGQYFDSETGLHYNYFRDYEPGTGRYVQSDPIGLRGGITTYGYVSSSPLSSSDEFGLATWKTDIIVFRAQSSMLPLPLWIKAPLSMVEGDYIQLSLNSQCFDYITEYNLYSRPNQQYSYGVSAMQARTGIDTSSDLMQPGSAVLNDYQAGPPDVANLAGNVTLSGTVLNGQFNGQLTVGKATGSVSLTAINVPDGPYSIAGNGSRKGWSTYPKDCSCSGGQ